MRAAGQPIKQKQTQRKVIARARERAGTDKFISTASYSRRVDSIGLVFLCYTYLCLRKMLRANCLPPRVFCVLSATRITRMNMKTNRGNALNPLSFWCQSTMKKIPQLNIGRRSYKLDVFLPSRFSARFWFVSASYLKWPHIILCVFWETAV